MTPLHIIQGNLELAQSGMELDLDIVRKQVDRLSYFVKMNVAMQECKLENINSNDIKTYIKLLANIYTSVDFNICIENDIQFPTKIENFYRIIDNLVNNALKHAKPNNISFSLKELEHSYLMCVTNDGAPISPNILEALFERHTSTSSTGIGLDIVSSIIEDLGYTINVNTTSDSTSFSVSIKK